MEKSDRDRERFQDCKRLLLGEQQAVWGTGAVQELPKRGPEEDRKVLQAPLGLKPTLGQPLKLFVTDNILINTIFVSAWISF